MNKKTDSSTKTTSAKGIYQIILSGLVLGLLIGGILYYIQMQQNYNLEKNNQNQTWEAKLSSAISTTNSLQKKIDELEKQISELNTDQDNYPEGFIENICIAEFDEAYISTDNLRDTLKKINIADEMINSFITNETLNNVINLETTVHYSICKFNNDEITFILYGDYSENNNLIGFFKKETNNKYTLTYAYENNPPVGDIGMCEIQGYVNGFQNSNIIYSCSGGDGPTAEDKIYSLNVETGEKMLMQHCNFNFGKSECPTDNFN